MAAGFRAIAGSAALLRITVASTISFAGVGMLVVACPLIGAQALGSEGRGTALLSLVAACSLVTIAVLARRPAARSHERRFLLATVALGLGLLVLALAPSSVPVVLLGAALVGLADGPQLAAVFVIRQREAPERLRGQIFTTAASLKLTAAAVGALLAGALAPRSLSACLALACALQLLAAASLALPRTTRSSWPDVAGRPRSRTTRPPAQR